MKRGDEAGNHSASPFPVLGLRPARLVSKPQAAFSLRHFGGLGGAHQRLSVSPRYQFMPGFARSASLLLSAGLLGG